MFDKKYKYIAMDSDGYSKFFIEKPEPHEEGTCWYSTEYDVPLIKGVFNLGNDWKESLHEIVHNDDGSVYLRRPRYDFKVDDKVLVRKCSSKGDGRWIKRYFSHWESDGKPRCFANGATEFSADGVNVWDEIKSYVEGE